MRAAIRHEPVAYTAPNSVQEGLWVSYPFREAIVTEWDFGRDGSPSGSGGIGDMKVAFIGTHGVGKTTLCYHQRAAATSGVDAMLQMLVKS